MTADDGCKRHRTSNFETGGA